MNRLSFSCRLLIPIAIVWLQPPSAWAQRATGPYAGLFGGGTEGLETAQSLQLRGALFGAWDDVVVSQGHQAPVDRRFLASRTGAGAHGALSYLRRTNAIRFSATGSSDLMAYPGADDATAVGHGGGTTFDANLGSYVAVKVNGSAFYSSFYQFAPFLDTGVGDVGPLTPGFAFSSAAERNARLASAAGLVITSSRRSSVSGDVNWSEWRFLDRPDYTVETRGASGAFRYQATRAFGVRAGYGYQEGRYHFAGTEPVEMQTIDMGVDYRDTLAFARRTALSFGSSTSALRIDDETHYRVNGSAVLSRGFRRTWSTSLGYARDTSFIAGFRAPVLSDSVNAAVGGLLSRRVRWKTGVGYSRGTVGFGTANTFSTYSGATRLELALTRRLGVYGQYAYYRYRVPAGSTAAELVPRFARQAATAGLTLWVPIVNEVRTPRDTR